MSFKKGLDQQVIDWIKTGKSFDEARFLSDKEVYASNQIKYSNRSYWQTQINKICLPQPFSGIAPAETHDIQSPYPNRLSVNAFKNELQTMECRCEIDILNYAIDCGQNEFLRCMFESGTDKDKIVDDKRVWRMIHLAVMNTDILRIKFLVAHNADINVCDYQVCKLIYFLENRSCFFRYRF